MSEVQTPQETESNSEAIDKTLVFDEKMISEADKSVDEIFADLTGAQTATEEALQVVVEPQPSENLLKDSEVSSTELPVEQEPEQNLSGDLTLVLEPTKEYTEPDNQMEHDQEDFIINTPAGDDESAKELETVPAVIEKNETETTKDVETVEKVDEVTPMETDETESKLVEDTEQQIVENEGDDLISKEELTQKSPDAWVEKEGEEEDQENEEIEDEEDDDEEEQEVATAPTIQPAWAKGLTQDDINQIHKLGSLSRTELITEVKKLYDAAFKLGLKEAKEMTRGKYLNIFSNSMKKN